MGFCGLGGWPADGAEAATLTLYRDQHAQTVDLLIADFEKGTGTKARVHSSDWPEIAGGDGPVDVLVCPKQLRLSADHGPRDVDAPGIQTRVREVTYYGPDASVSLSSNEGDPATTIIARAPGHMSPHPGDSALIAVEGDVVGYVGEPRAAY